ncbi:hypothetical protein HMSSN036_61850 [Paenibacillus macerans]|nr:hypothetical protein HMSSN036_61850 [Paenibacillus macerans]
MFDPVADFRLFGGVEPRLVISRQIPGDPAQAADVHVVLMAAAGRAGRPDDAFVAAGRAAVDRMVDAEIADLLLQGVLNDFQKSGLIVPGIAVKFDVRNGSRVAKPVELGFQLDFFAALML